MEKKANLAEILSEYEKKYPGLTIFHHDLFFHVNNPGETRIEPARKIEDLFLLSRDIASCDEDPRLVRLYLDKVDEVAIKTAMIQIRGTRGFSQLGHYLYIERYVEENPGFISTIRQAALGILADARRFPKQERYIGAEVIADAFGAAFTELGIQDHVQINITAGNSMCMDQDGTLNIGQELMKSELELVKSISHETLHAMPIVNSRDQSRLILPLSRFGLPNYESSIEGFTDHAEGLTFEELKNAGHIDDSQVDAILGLNLRKMAAYVIAILDYADGMTRKELYDVLKRNVLRKGNKDDEKIAREVAMRVKRASDDPDNGVLGCFPKDIIYLAGRIRVKEYLKGKPIPEAVMVADMDVNHIPMMESLITENIVKPPLYKHRPVLDIMVEILQGKYRRDVQDHHR